MTPEKLALAIDSTNLRLDASDADIVHLCEEALSHGFACVMVYPTSIRLAATILKATGPRIGTVVGFPSGRFSTVAKIAEIDSAAEAGATEVDVVMNYAALREGRTGEVAAELEAVTARARERQVVLKVIVETCFLGAGQRMEALRLCEEAGADFIKTSTGFGSAGAQIQHVRDWCSARTTGIEVKASGGIKSLSHVLGFMDAGASRIGTSNAASIVAELRGFAGVGPRPGDDY